MLPVPVQHVLKSRVMGVNDFRDLVAWQLADELRREVIAFTDIAPAARDFKFGANTNYMKYLHRCIRSGDNPWERPKRRKRTEPRLKDGNDGPQNEEQGTKNP